MTVPAISTITFVSLALGLATLPARSEADAASLDRGLALHLPLTRDLDDHSPARHPIEVIGNVRIEGEGAYFGGLKDWLEAPHIPLNDRPFAITAWLRPTGVGRHIGFFEQCDLNRPGHHFHLMLRENRQPYIGFYFADQISPLSAGWEGEWIHLTFQYADGFQQIWINGHLITTRRNPPYQGTTGITAIGKTPRWYNVPSDDFVGFMRDFRIYQRELAGEEIARLSIPWNTASTEDSSDVNAGDEPVPSGKRNNAALAAILPEDKSQPFLEIDGKQITINGRPGQIYVLQSTADFKSWTPLSRVTNETGRATYVESDDTSVRFYRVLIGAPHANPATRLTD